MESNVLAERRHRSGLNRKGTVSLRFIRWGKEEKEQRTEKEKKNADLPSISAHRIVQLLCGEKEAADRRTSLVDFFPHTHTHRNASFFCRAYPVLLLKQKGSVTFAYHVCQATDTLPFRRSDRCATETNVVWGFQRAPATLL
ncbi:hypothetical protein PHSY_000349 [Pseudozyma hubeiensis SY62]|uniref:Uncharacterized protein n=1 Tax=Pseudozyma hubeiensis (strain SY62) TaxID=1305764 RepID=R9NW64_PSEHS|nr:hypothetical protein PHSY_000349 [Pseudozyma hubeiensis SY62]GAC92793.1 hypothetical protein PHSY_000349 [Pseudozyma hubeiensis SY62]